MAKKLYVGGLSFNSTEDSLRSEFSKLGTVESATVITDRISGRSKGFGFIEMATEEEAQKAIEALNGKEFDGRTITVSEARPQSSRPQRRESSGWGNDRGGGYGKDSRRRSW